MQVTSESASRSQISTRQPPALLSLTDTFKLHHKTVVHITLRARRDPNWASTITHLDAPPNAHGTTPTPRQREHAPGTRQPGEPRPRATTGQTRLTDLTSREAPAAPEHSATCRQLHEPKLTGQSETKVF